ncbi:MAG: DsbA family protein [Hyphomonadaceae bacterium]
MTLFRRDVLALAAAALLATACNTGGGAASDAADMTIGAANAPVSLIEYASTTCPHCAEFHRTVWPQLKANYIDAGKVRFTFREFPTPPAEVAVAAFQLARCGGAAPEQYLARVGVIFDQQQAMFATGTAEGVRQKLVQIGQEAGLSEDQVMACINDEHGPARVRQVVADGERQFNITGTPTLILNGKKLEDPSAMTYAGLSRLIDAAIAGH